MLTVDDGWLAGIIEGEGSIGLKHAATGRRERSRVRLRVKMVDEDVVARVAAAFGSAYWRRDPNGPKAPAHWSVQYETELAGSRAVELLTRLLPLFGDRRRARIAEVIAATAG